MSVGRPSRSSRPPARGSVSWPRPRARDRRSVRGSPDSAGSSRRSQLREHGAWLLALAHLLVGDHVRDRVDQGQVGERLWIVAELGAAPRLDLLAVEAEGGAVSQQSLAELAGPLALPDFRERRNQPEGADRERPLLAGETVVGLIDAIAEHQPV